jgi:hypothetical protein
MNIQSFLFSVIVVSGFSACNGIENNDSENAMEFTADEEELIKHKKYSSVSVSNGNYWQKMMMHEVRDNKGTILFWQPLPSDWKFNSHPADGVTIRGPHGIKVTDYPLQSYMHDYSGMFGQSSMPNRAMPHIDELIQQDVIPSAASIGLRYIKNYELPEVSKMDKWYSDQLYSITPLTKYIKVFGIDWQDNNGNEVFSVLHVSSSKGQYSEVWSYRVSLLEAEPSVFKLARKQYVFSLANMRYNLEPIMAYNQAEAQRIGQSWDAFNKRMAANQAAFEASQRAHINRTNAINDAIMSNWRSSNAASDKNQEQFIDYVYENQNVVNEETGKAYKVQQGYNQYWMNNDGEYIGTPSNTYNPNLDENLNEQNWQKLNQVK